MNREMYRMLQSRARPPRLQSNKAELQVLSEITESLMDVTPSCISFPVTLIKAQLSCSPSASQHADKGCRGSPLPSKVTTNYSRSLATAETSTFYPNLTGEEEDT